MKRAILLISAALLSMIAGIQTALAQKVTLYMAGNEKFVYDISQVDSIVFSDTPATVEPEEIVVTVDANGNADGGHYFSRIDDTTFIIDDLKYTVQNGDLVVSGYDQAFFTGIAKIISKLNYRGRLMNVVGIGNSAFSGCTILTSITIPNSVTSIGQQAFRACSSLTSITIPESVTSIGDSAFSGCTGLTSITIPESVTSIGGSAFSYCSSLTSIIIPNSVSSIERYALYGCTSLTSITIPNSVTSIGDYAFSGCIGLTSITTPNSVTSIGSNAFSGCTCLASVIIGSGVTSINPSAFWGCTGLTSIIVESGNTIYDSRNNCNAIIKTATNALVRGCKNTTIPNSVTAIESDAFRDCTGLTSITIPNSVTSIGNRAFYGCTSLTIVTIPNSVTSIGNFAFSGCSSLTDVLLNSDSVVSASRSYNSSMKSIFGEQVEHYMIGDSVTSIGNSAFYGCTGLTSVTIPESVTSIGSYAFYGCTGLTSVAIPESVTSIGNNAFYNCSSLIDFYCYARNVPYCGSSVFENSSISSATLHVPAGSVDAYKARAPWKDFGSIVAIE